MDPDGKDLQFLLGALIPVCGGINLQYYFSRIDNEVYGAGSKLPHNIVSLLGVSNGVEGDLRVGLPAQMVEIHDPVRLLLVIEQKAEIALQAVQREPALFQWVKNEWIRYSTVDPLSGEVSVFSDGKMVGVDLTHTPPTRTAQNSSVVITQGARRNLSPVFLTGIE
jgi:uncharacterized protein